MQKFLYGRHQPKVKTEKGAQIDLLIDRNDSCINVCEMKFSQSSFEIAKAYETELANKLEVFRKHTKTKKTVSSWKNLTIRGKCIVVLFVEFKK